MKKFFWITGVVLGFFLLTLNSYGTSLKDIYSQKNYDEISKQLSTELTKAYQKSLEKGDPEVCSGNVDLIIVDKPNNKMFLYDDTNCIVKEYEVRLGASLGPKHFEGDKKTPEGLYRIQNKYASTKYEKFLLINYPNKQQKKYAESKGLSAGGEVGIHFFASEKLRGSQGCITVKTKEEINEIYNLVEVGTLVKILPDKKK